MRIRKKKWAAPELAACRYFVKNPEDFRGRWHSFFQNDHPIQLEIGCGKCSFIAEKARRAPDINFIAVDIKSDMLGVGRRNIEKLFCDHALSSPRNIALAAYNVENIEKIFSKEDRIEALYINFCNPWPREKHKKRRLTFPKKLNKYKDFLTEDAKVFFKTDDDLLFEDSLRYFEEAGYAILFTAYDLHRSSVPDNIETEHEKMFSEKGVPIKYLEAAPVSASQENGV